jgi:hypothetical protein
MARSCPRDLIRAVVERTLEGDALGDATDVSVAEEHLERCSGCRAFKARLERDERAIRRAVRDLSDAAAIAAATGDADECPSPGDLAAFSEGALQGARRERIENHCVACELCRSVSSISSVIATAPADPLTEEQLTPTRRRLESLQSPAGTATAEPARRVSARRRAAVAQAPSRSAGPFVAIAATAALAFVAGAIALSGDTAPELEPEPVTQKTDAPKPAPAPKAPAPAPTPVAKPQPEPELPPAPQPDPDDIVAEGPAAQRPDGVGGVPQDLPQGPQQPSAQPATPQPGTTTQPAPKQPAPNTPLTQPLGELACSIESFSGPLEIKKRVEKTWRKMVLADVVQEGDGLRSRGTDGSLTLKSRAKFTLAADAVATTSVTKGSVKIHLESGTVDGEALAYNGLEVEDKNGTVTVWQGAKAHVESTEAGLKVSIETGRAWVANAHGKTVVKAGQELLLTADKKPASPWAKKAR